MKLFTLNSYYEARKGMLINYHTNKNNVTYPVVKAKNMFINLATELQLESEDNMMTEISNANFIVTKNGTNLFIPEHNTESKEALVLFDSGCDYDKIFTSIKVVPCPDRQKLVSGLWGQVCTHCGTSLIDTKIVPEVRRNCVILNPEKVHFSHYHTNKGDSAYIKDCLEEGKIVNGVSILIRKHYFINSYGSFRYNRMNRYSFLLKMEENATLYYMNKEIKYDGEKVTIKEINFSEEGVA